MVTPTLGARPICGHSPALPHEAAFSGASLPRACGRSWICLKSLFYFNSSPIPPIWTTSPSLRLFWYARPGRSASHLCRLASPRSEFAAHALYRITQRRHIAEVEEADSEIPAYICEAARFAYGPSSCASPEIRCPSSARIHRARATPRRCYIAARRPLYSGMGHRDLSWTFRVAPRPIACHREAETWAGELPPNPSGA